MYAYEWTAENGIFELNVNSKVPKEIRPVFKEELDYFGFNKVWDYPDTKAPLLWAEGVRRYVLNGELVAEAKGGGFYTKPKIDIKKKSLNLSPIDIEFLWETNEKIMSGLIIGVKPIWMLLFFHDITLLSHISIVLSLGY